MDLLTDQIVYRVEHETNHNAYSGHYTGPFTGGSEGINAYRYTEGVSDDPTNHPSPEGDGLGRMADSDICGTLNLDQILTWFPNLKGRQAMRDAGFVVRAYLISKVEFYSDLQCLINVKQIDSDLVEVIDLTSF